ncbi:hypothetical protein RSOLAG22IIIB_09126 [Rhizoctonia solani]|uniref:Uncharacterized protein n=1 Tax=Rhizoctonia solani TaxID=456999 RepID=A0A0K6FXB0_9AGAM|nr:hypothetical protein RSOLAG22IIIB_09126 [Rhizoctonia solani]
METMEVEGEGEVGCEAAPWVTDEVAINTEPEETEEEEEDETTMDDPKEQEDEIDNEQGEPHSPIKHSPSKDMFKPQEEFIGFLLGRDIELDPDAESFLPASISVLPPSEPLLAPASIVTEKRAHTIQFAPDPSIPLFFLGGKNKIFCVIGENGRIPVLLKKIRKMG